jgi:hypothetical protein
MGYAAVKFNDKTIKEDLKFDTLTLVVEEKVVGNLQSLDKEKPTSVRIV